MNRNKNTQEGGAEAEANAEVDKNVIDPKYNIPEFREPMNNPMIPNEQRRIYAENKQMKERETKNTQGEPIINLQLYQPPKPKPSFSSKPQPPNPAVFFPNYVPNPFNPVAYANYMHFSGYGMQQPAPIYKEYNININGVSGSHIKTAMFFEDVLPVKNVSGSFKSVSERQTMYESIRANLFSDGDGKDVPIENDTYNLLSHLKLMDMNPYNSSRFSTNPYKGLPFGFLLYRSCYPMRHNTKYYEAVCAPNSTGINVRIYRLTDGAYTVNKQDITRIADHDEWREMAFYNYVKENVLKSKVCPNFPYMYGYNIALNSNINFDDLKMIQAQPQNSRTTDKPLINPSWVNPDKNMTQQNINTAMDTLRRVNIADQNMPKNTAIPVTGNAINPANIKQVVTNIRDPVTGLIIRQVTNAPTQADMTVMLNKYTGKALVCLTEACNYTLFGWAKKEYRADGNIKTMINSGYHSKAVWESVIFQLLAALYVMQIKGIIINDFRLDRNVFIKDISIGGPASSYWKYKIHGIEYYVPNNGYLLMIDSNYRDFDRLCDENTATDKNRKRKLDGAFINGSKLTQDECIRHTFEMFKSAVDPNVFNQDFVNDNGVKPPEEIIRLLTGLKNAADSAQTMNISYYIRKFMPMFLNNRIGGPLTDTETNNVKRGAIKDFRKGQIVVMTDSDGIDKFVLHVSRNNETSLIITKDNISPDIGNFIEKSVPTSSLNEYSVIESIKQNFKNETNLSDEALIETYTIE